MPNLSDDAVTKMRTFIKECNNPACLGMVEIVAQYVVHDLDDLTLEDKEEAIQNGDLTVIPLEIMSTIMEELALPPELRSKKILDKDSGDVEMIQLVLGLLASV